MRDLIFLLVFAAFFAIAVGVLRLCERIIGPDDAATDGSETAPAAELVDAA
jgi:hypothetical protein